MGTNQATDALGSAANLVAQAAAQARGHRSCPADAPGLRGNTAASANDQALTRTTDLLGSRG